VRLISCHGLHHSEFNFFQTLENITNQLKNSAETQRIILSYISLSKFCFYQTIKILTLQWWNENSWSVFVFFLNTIWKWCPYSVYCCLYLYTAIFFAYLYMRMKFMLQYLCTYHFWTNLLVFIVFGMNTILLKARLSSEVEDILAPFTAMTSNFVSE